MTLAQIFLSYNVCSKKNNPQELFAVLPPAVWNFFVKFYQFIVLTSVLQVIVV